MIFVDILVMTISIGFWRSIQRKNKSNKQQRTYPNNNDFNSLSQHFPLILVVTMSIVRNSSENIIKKIMNIISGFDDSNPLTDNLTDLEVDEDYNNIYSGSIVLHKPRSVEKTDDFFRRKGSFERSKSNC